jgi:hypothetical protein
MALNRGITISTVQARDRKSFFANRTGCQHGIHLSISAHLS